MAFQSLIQCVLVKILHETNVNPDFSAGSITNVNGTSGALDKAPIENPSVHDLQVYGIVVTILLVFIVFGGVKMINRVAPAFLVPVLFSVLCIIVGVFASSKDKPSGMSCFY